MTRKPTMTASLLALALLAAPLAAEEQAQVQMPEPAQITAEEVTEAQIEGFVKAAIAVESLRHEYMVRIGNAESKEAAEKLKAEADSVAIQLVDKVKNITAAEYLTISRLLNEDDELNARITAELDEMRAQKAAFEKKEAEKAAADKARRAAEAQKAASDTAKENAGESDAATAD